MNCAISKKDKTQPLSSDNVKMLGFPLQSLNKYLNILVEAGYQVKVIEQNAIGKIHGKVNPKNNGKIERTTKGVYSRGTMIDLDNKDNNYILSLWLDKDDHNLDIIGVTICDIGTGLLEIKDTLCNKDDVYQALDEVSLYINTYNPTEIILSNTENILKKVGFYMYKLDIPNYWSTYVRIKNGRFKSQESSCKFAKRLEVSY